MKSKSITFIVILFVLNIVGVMAFIFFSYFMEADNNTSWFYGIATMAGFFVLGVIQLAVAICLLFCKKSIGQKTWLSVMVYLALSAGFILYYLLNQDLDTLLSGFSGPSIFFLIVLNLINNMVALNKSRKYRDQNKSVIL